jgi:hypothetical protein
LLHSCHHTFIVVLLYCFRFRSASRQCPLSFKSILDSISKPKFHRRLFKIIAFHFWKKNLGFKIRFKFDLDSKPYFQKNIRKRNFQNVRHLNFELNFKIVSIQKSHNLKLDFQKDLNAVLNFQNLASVYFHYSLFKALDLILNI